MCTASGCLYILVRGKREKEKPQNQGDVQLPCVFSESGTPSCNSIKMDFSDRCRMVCMFYSPVPLLFLFSSLVGLLRYLYIIKITAVDIAGYSEKKALN